MEKYKMAIILPLSVPQYKHIFLLTKDIFIISLC